MYEVSFVKLSDRFFKGTTWPSVDSIADLVDRDHVFCLLYKVLIAFRFAKGSSEGLAGPVPLSLSVVHVC